MTDRRCVGDILLTVCILCANQQPINRVTYRWNYSIEVRLMARTSQPCVTWNYFLHYVLSELLWVQKYFFLYISQTSVRSSLTCVPVTIYPSREDISRRRRRMSCSTAPATEDYRLVVFSFLPGVDLNESGVDGHRVVVLPAGVDCAISWDSSRYRWGHHLLGRLRVSQGER